MRRLRRRITRRRPFPLPPPRQSPPPRPRLPLTRPTSREAASSFPPPWPLLGSLGLLLRTTDRGRVSSLWRRCALPHTRLIRTPLSGSVPGGYGRAQCTAYFRAAHADGART